jgi:serine-type D-Ala-D-Ala carboxypeptidase (penicillin-binding protein 5/6)
LMSDFRMATPLLKFLKKRPFQVYSLGAVLLFSLFLPGQNFYETLHLETKAPLVRTGEPDNFTASLYPQRVTTEAVPFISAQAAVILDLESGVFLLSQNPHERLRPASITKLMTALVALDYYQPDHVLTVRRLAPAKGESEMGLAVGDRVRVKDLLFGLLVPSGNDAAYTLADNYPGGIENFLYAMNKKAEALHMDDTHFANPSGLDEDNHYSSAEDIAILTVAALKNDLISQIVSTYGITLSDETGKKRYTLKNVNQFLGFLYGADGVKTGYTDLAGECLVASVSRDSHRVISVVLKSNDRFGDSARLLEWAYRNFSWVNLYDLKNT